jgi:hypothetical protein
MFKISRYMLVSFIVLFVSMAAAYAIEPALGDDLGVQWREVAEEQELTEEQRELFAMFNADPTVSTITAELARLGKILNSGKYEDGSDADILPIAQQFRECRENLQQELRSFVDTLREIKCGR